MNNYFSLSNLLLWRKGWYQSVNPESTMIDTMRKVLKLDGYEFVISTDDITNIVTRAFDEYCESMRKKNTLVPSLQQIYINARDRYNYHKYQKDLYYLGIDFPLCLSMAILDYLAWRPCGSKPQDEIRLIKPHFDRKLYKQGLKCSSPNFVKGVTYKEINRFVDTFNW